MLVFLTIVIVFVVFVLIWFIMTRNSFVMMEENINRAWSNIDVLLKQRHDELTKLLNTVKGYMKYEKNLLKEITEARANLGVALKTNDPETLAKANSRVSGVLTKLIAVAENYPDLKANKNFMQLQTRISELENQIADRREFYNDSVNLYNIRIRQFPGNIVAGMLGLQRHKLFEATEEERKDVEISF